MPPEYNVTNSGETKDAFNNYQNASFVSGDAHTSTSQSLTAITHSVVNYIAVMPSDSGRIQEGLPSEHGEVDFPPYIGGDHALAHSPTSTFQALRGWPYATSPRFSPLTLETIYDEPNDIAQQTMSPTSVKNVQQIPLSRHSRSQPSVVQRNSDVEKGHRANAPLPPYINTNAGDTTVSGSSGHIQPSPFNSSSPAGPSGPTPTATVSYIEVSTQQYVSSPNTPAKSLVGQTMRTPHAKEYLSVIHHIFGCRTLVALWSPTKSSRAELGDVGCIDGDGAFQPFFNVFTSHDDPINTERRLRPPPGFQSFLQGRGPLVRGTDFAVDTRCKIRLTEPRHTHVGKMRTKLIEGAKTRLECTVLEDGPGAGIFLPCGGEILQLSVDLEEEVAEKIVTGAYHWLGHCEILKERDGLKDAKLLVITRRCLSQSWAAASYVKPSKRDFVRLPGETVMAVATPTERHTGVFTWSVGTGGPGMDWQNEPQASVIDPTRALPLDLCIAVGGLVISYEKVKLKKLSRQGNSDTSVSGSVSTRTIGSTLKSGKSSILSRLSRLSLFSQSTKVRK